MKLNLEGRLLTRLRSLFTGAHETSKDDGRSVSNIAISTDELGNKAIEAIRWKKRAAYLQSRVRTLRRDEFLQIQFDEDQKRIQRGEEVMRQLIDFEKSSQPLKELQKVLAEQVGDTQKPGLPIDTRIRPEDSETVLVGQVGPYDLAMRVDGLVVIDYFGASSELLTETPLSVFLDKANRGFLFQDLERIQANPDFGQIERKANDALRNATAHGELKMLVREKFPNWL